MNAICSLCGTIITAEPDSLLDVERDDRTFGRLGGSFGAHLRQYHNKETQKALAPGMTRGCETWTVEQMIGVVGNFSQAVILFSYLISEDPVFTAKNAAMRQILAAAIEPKKSNPVSVIK